MEWREKACLIKSPKFVYKVIQLIKKILKPVKVLLVKDIDFFLRDISGVIHVGASTGQERDLYKKHGLEVIWVEPNPIAFKCLSSNIESYDNQIAFQALLTEKEDNEYDFHLSSNNGESSSILDLKYHKELFPEVGFVKTIPLRSTTLTSLIQKNQIDVNRFQALILDTQGSELMVLNGSLPLLKNFKYIKSEVPNFESYEGCCQVEDILKFMDAYGYKKVFSKEFAGDPAIGGYFDIVFRKRGFLDSGVVSSFSGCLKKMLIKPLIKFLRRATPLGKWVDHRRHRDSLISCSESPPEIHELGSEWWPRIKDVLDAPDNAFLPRHAEAGKTRGPVITMHNGVKIYSGSYYGDGNFRILVDNRGAHEPQEERAFAEVMEFLPENCVMLELGAYWAFYSLSLLARHPKAECHLVEPGFFHMSSGMWNFKLNNRKGLFTQAFVSDFPAQASEDAPETISVDSYCRRKKIPHLHILHSDIQGYEGRMLDGAREMLSAEKVDFVFISTHSNELHGECIRKLKSFEYKILAQANLEESYSYDGLIVAKSPRIDKPLKIEISRKGRIPRL